MGTLPTSTYDFLLVFYNNYGPISYPGGELSQVHVINLNTVNTDQRLRYLLAGVLNPGVISPGNGVVRPRGSTAVVFMSPIAAFLFSTESGTGVNLRTTAQHGQATII